MPFHSAATRKVRWRLLLPFVWLVSPLLLYGETSTTTTLSVSPSPATFGQPVMLTAHITPAAAAGKVTFFSGTAIIGVVELSGGEAAITTSLLPSGVNSISVFYPGSSSYSSSKSATSLETIKTVGATAFQIAASYPVGSSPRGLAAADFNGDGKADLAVVNENSNTLSILLGTGEGGFVAGETYAVGYDPWFVTTGDFNGDGRTDLVVVSTLDENSQVAMMGQLSILLGNGDGTFQSPITVAAGYSPATVAVADFNLDGIADLVFTENGSSEVAVLLGNGDGTFRTAASYSQPGASGVATGDFNRDGKPDFALAGPGYLIVYLGNGDGTFQLSPSQYAAGPHSYPGYLAVSDLNGDGKLDIVAPGTQPGSTITVWLGKGDGTFLPGSSYPAGQAPFSVAITDLNGDGKPDLVVPNLQSDNLSFLYGNGDGTFQPAVAFPGNPQSEAFFGPDFVVVADFNSDGVPDLAIANSGFNEVTIVLGAATVAPDVMIAKTHTGTFAQGQDGAAYTITVSNVGLAATTAPVTVVDDLPKGLTATAISGIGWSCTLTPLSCTRSDPLAIEAAYPPITVAVDVASDAPISVTNTATVAGGGESNTGNDSASDVTAIHQAAAPVVSGIVNGSFNSGALPASPGSLISIFGSNLAISAQSAAADSGRLPLELAGASVQIGSMSAPLLYVSPKQINAQVPFELGPGTYPVSVDTVTGPSNLVNLAVTATSPGMFPNAVVSNATGAPINAGNPFRPGDVIVIYCTGLGVVSPSANTGLLAPSSPISHTIASPTVTIGGLPVQVASSVLSPGFVGLYQIGIVVPGGLPEGTQPLVVTSGGVAAAAVLVFSAPSLNPNYCADVSGEWNVTESGTITEVISAAVETDNITNPYSVSGTANIVQTECSISYIPPSIPGLITPAQAAALTRTGKVVGNKVSIQGLLTTASLAVANNPNLTITTATKNQFQASGQATGAVLQTNDSGNFAGSGTYSENGQTGSFTITYVLTGTPRWSGQAPDRPVRRA